MSTAKFYWRTCPVIKFGCHPHDQTNRHPTAANSHCAVARIQLLSGPFLQALAIYKSSCTRGYVRRPLVIACQRMSYRFCNAADVSLAAA